MVLFMIVYSSLYLLVGENSYVYIAERERGKNNYLAIITARQEIDSYYPNHKYKDFRIWFREDPNYDTFFSLAATYLYPWGSAIGQFHSGMAQPDKLFFHDRDSLTNGDDLVILSSDENVSEILLEANDAIKFRNGSVELQQTVKVEKDSLHFYLYFVKIFIEEVP